MTQPTAQDEVMMAKALVEARTALANGGAGIAALLLWGDEILALDHNRYDKADQTAHAKMVVLRQAAQRLSGISDAQKAELTLYTTLEPC